MDIDNCLDEKDSSIIKTEMEIEVDETTLVYHNLDVKVKNEPEYTSDYDNIDKTYAKLETNSIDCDGDIKLEADELDMPDIINSEHLNNVGCESFTIKEEIIDTESQNKNIKILFDDDLQGGTLKSFQNIHCSKCGEEYSGYCCNCPMLCQILHNSVPKTDPDWSRRSIPKNILEVRHKLVHLGVFALKTIPKNVIFGPFEDLEVKASTVGGVWKIKDNKFVAGEHCNWMQHIDYAKTDASHNLSVFQHENKLYYQSDRQINTNEELLIHYGKGHLMSTEVAYFVPSVNVNFPVVYGCTFCCLGFSSEDYLTEHKFYCPESIKNDVNAIIQCPSCKIYLEEQEHAQYHSTYCEEANSRICDAWLTINEDTIKTKLYLEKSVKRERIQEIQEALESYECEPRLRRHNNEVKCFECQVCDKRFRLQGQLNRHLQTHKDVKCFECKICGQGFTKNYHLRNHVKETHTGEEGKIFKCTICHFKTCRKGTLVRHLYTHADVKPYTCKVCKVGYVQEYQLKLHIQNKHGTGAAKTFKCAECPHQTNCKSGHLRHVNTHTNVK